MMKYSVVLPCRNEAATIGICIDKIREAFSSMTASYEIIVSDSSKDGSDIIASRKGAKVVYHKEGYGEALMAGFRAAKGDYIIMGDADDTYNFLELGRLVRYSSHYDMVIGSRFKGRILPGAMPALHRYLGNPLLTFALNMMFGSRISDAHSGFRMIRRDALARLSLTTTGMEFASEMVIKAVKRGLRIKEVPITYYPRRGSSSLDSWRDGWRHLRFMLLYSPTVLFLAPGAALSVIGLVLLVAFSIGPQTIGGFTFDIHPIIVGSVLTLSGTMLIIMGTVAKVFAHVHLGERSRLAEELFRLMPLERGMLLSSIIILIGLFLGLRIVVLWIMSGFGPLDELRQGIASLTILMVGMMLFFSAFFLSIIGIRKK